MPRLSAWISATALLPAAQGHTFMSQLAVDGPAPGPAPAQASLGFCGCPSVPEDQCTCGASLSFLQCVHKRCTAGECECPKDTFASECSAVSQACSSELNVDGCHSLQTSCEGRYHQAADGVTGLSLDTTHLWEEGYCGPHGRCTGEVHVRATALRAEAGAWLECVLPSGEKKKKLHRCRTEVADEGAAGCTLAMPSFIEPSGAVRGHCFLTEGKKGPKLTKDAWFVVRNRHSAEDAAAAVVAAAPKAVTAKKTTVVLERADETDAAEKEAEIKEEEVEEAIQEEGAETGAAPREDPADDGEHFFKKHTPVAVKEGVGAKTKEPKVSWTYTWIPLVMIVALVLAIAALIAGKRRSETL